jgi:hypothetical protein
MRATNSISASRTQKDGRYRATIVTVLKWPKIEDVLVPAAQANKGL